MLQTLGSCFYKDLKNQNHVMENKKKIIKIEQIQTNTFTEGS